MKFKETNFFKNGSYPIWLSDEKLSDFLGSLLLAKSWKSLILWYDKDPESALKPLVFTWGNSDIEDRFDYNVGRDFLNNAGDVEFSDLSTIELIDSDFVFKFTNYRGEERGEYQGWVLDFRYN